MNTINSWVKEAESMYSFNLENINVMYLFVISNNCQETDLLSLLTELCQKHFNIKIARGKSEMSNYICFQRRNYVLSEKKKSYNILYVILMSSISLSSSFR